MNSEATLTSIAMLKVSIDHGKDYLEYLKPFVLRILFHCHLELITDATVADKLRDEHGLEIPRRTVQIVLQRFVKAGFITKADGVFQVVREIEVKDWISDKADATRRITAVVNSLKIFARECAHRELSEEVLMDTLIAFLSRFSIPCLKAYLRGTALPSLNGENWKVVLVSQFVRALQDSSLERFNDFISVVQGHMLANAFLCPDLQSIANTYKEVTFYLDTPLLVQYLGLEGPEKKLAIDELIDLIQRLDGTISYFTHTREEMLNVIYGASEYIESTKGRGAIVYESRRSHRTKSDLILIAERAVEMLAAKKIEARQTPAYIPQFQIDESAFSETLSDEVNYYNHRAREYDINSVRSIYALRKGSCPHSIERSKAVLVTNNSGFSKAAYEYGKNIEQSREVSTVITDFSLVNTAWLKAPQGAPSLPRKEVLAFVYAALRPTNEFWEKVLTEANKLEKDGKITSRDHQLLRSSYHVQEELMKLTLGEDGALSEATITTTLSRVAEEIRKEESDKLHKVMFAKEEVEQKLKEITVINEEIKGRIYWRCDTIAKRDAAVLTAIIWIGQVSVAAFGVINILSANNIGWMLLSIAIISGLLRLGGSIWDLKIFDVYKKYREWRRQRLVAKEYVALGIK